MAIDKEESYVMFANEDWRSPFIQYLTKGNLPQKHNERNKLRKLETHYFLHEGILLRKGYNRDLLQCLGPEEDGEMLKEVHTRECGGY